MKVYERVEQALRDQADNLTVPQGTSREDVFIAVRRVMRENPDIFWFSNQWDYSEDKGIIRFHYTLSKDRRLKALAQIEDVVAHDFCIDEVRLLQPIEQVMYVYKWIALYCKYNIYSSFNQSIYSVFVYRNSVCTGFAKAAQYLLKLLGIESRLVFGTLNNSDEGSRHCWLILRVAGMKFHMDPSLAVPDIHDLLLKAGVKPVFGNDGLVYNYFCCDTRTIKDSRVIEEEETLPPCNYTFDSSYLQSITVRPYRDSDQGLNGTRGCLINDSGISSRIYLWHSADKAQQVLKVYKDVVTLSQIQHECKVMRKLFSSSNVIHLYGAREDLKGLLIEQATPLADLLRCNYFKLTARNFCKLLLDVMAGLRDCLELGIYYRDIHLNNIFRTSTGRYVIGDFGSCVWINEEKDKSDPIGLASPWYMAPETHRDGTFTESSSVYGIGMLAFFLLNELYPPLWSEYGSDSLLKRFQGYALHPPLLLQKSSNVFECRLSVIIQKALSFNEDDRYPNLTELSEAIVEAMSLIEDDYHLLTGGSSVIGENFNDLSVTSYSNLSSTDDFATTGHYQFPTMTPKGQFSQDCLDDFASTAESLIPNSSAQSAKTYIPEYLEEEKTAKSRTSILSRLFQRKKSQPSQQVYSSVFAPAEVKPRSHMLIQIYLHEFEKSGLVSRLAKETDKNAERRNYIPLSMKLKQGETVDIEMNIYGEGQLYSSRKSIVWQGGFSKCDFDYFIPATLDVSELSCEINMYKQNILVADMRFLTDVVESPKNLNSEIVSRTFNKIFISYAHQDSERVKDFALAYKAQGVEYFYDRDILKAGDVYEEKICEFIDSADLFILCWSENAAKSAYVSKEMHRALQKAYPYLSHKDATLKIYPISIEPRAEYPSEIRDVYNFELL